MVDFSKDTIYKDEFDIDLTVTILETKKLLKEKNAVISQSLAKLYSDSLMEFKKLYCRENQINQSKLEGGEYIVVNSRSGYYEKAIEFDLVVRPLFSLEIYLDYQMKNYHRKTKSDKARFVKMISTRVCKRISKNCPFDTATRLDKIMLWVRSQNTYLGYILDPIPFTIEADYQYELFRELKEYFFEKHWNDLEKIIQGIGIYNQVVFLENKNKLIDVFYRMHEEKILESPKTITAKWIAKNFRSYVGQREEYDVKKSELISYSSAYAAMKTNLNNRRPLKKDKISISFLRPIDSIAR